MTDVETTPTASDVINAFQPGSFALRDAWFPLVHTSRVRRRLIRRAIHGEPVFIWRENGKLVARENSPLAREAGSRRRASYFTGGTGNYPTAERFGYLWVWYGDPANASPELVPNIPTIPDGDSPWMMQKHNVIDCAYELYAENLLDLTHADFLHSYLMGGSISDNDEVTVTSTSETVTMVRTTIRQPTPKAQKAFVKSEFQDFRGSTLLHVRTGVAVIHAEFTPGVSLRMVIPCIPETATRTRTSHTFAFERATWLMSHLWTLNAHKVTREDNWALREENPNYFRELGKRDMNSRFDGGGLRLRKVHSELVARQRAGDFSYRADGLPSRDVREELGLAN